VGQRTAGSLLPVTASIYGTDTASTSLCFGCPTTSCWQKCLWLGVRRLRLGFAVKRNLYSDGHRRPGSEADLQQGATAPHRPAPRRHRTGSQRREPYAVTEERSPGAPFSHSSVRSHNSGSFLSDDQLRIEAERHHKSELKRLREEVLDIARELKACSTSKPGVPVRRALAARTRGSSAPSRPLCHATAG
jgi:hypothetical protein